MTPPREGSLRRGGFEFPYVEWDAEGEPVEPPILLLHGLGSNARYWSRVAAHLASRRLVALDLTPTEPADAALSELMADIAFAVDVLRLERPVVVGHSWGAVLGLEFVAAHPRLASGFVFVDGPITGVARMFSWDEVQAMMQPPFRHYTSAGEAFAESRGYFGEAWGDDLEDYVRAGLRPDGDGLIARLTPPVRLRILRDLHDSDPESLWQKVSVPVAALIARKHDSRIARATDEGMAGMAEIAPAVVVKRFATPHDIPLYAAEQVAREIELVASSAAAAPAESA